MVSIRKALCVGINKYRNYPDATLRGCVNDCDDMASVLKDSLSFPDDNIVRLKDAQATRENIMAHLEQMVADAKAHKVRYLVFSMSSHGTQVPDVSGDEPDRYDEAFCPYDLAEKAGQWDPDFIITDDQLHDLFVQLPDDVLLEVYLDTCHSGTGLKDIDFLPGRRRPRYLPPPSPEAVLALRDTQTRGFARKMADKALARHKIVHHILWAACRADQTSADAYLDGDYHGAFTYYLVKEVRAYGNRLRRDALKKKIAADLKAGYFPQVPQLETEATVREIAIHRAVGDHREAAEVEAEAPSPGSETQPQP